MRLTSSRLADQPVVPSTSGTPASAHTLTFFSTAWLTEKSIATSQSDKAWARSAGLRFVSCDLRVTAISWPCSLASFATSRPMAPYPIRAIFIFVFGSILRHYVVAKTSAGDFHSMSLRSRRQIQAPGGAKRNPELLASDDSKPAFAGERALSPAKA